MMATARQATKSTTMANARRATNLTMMASADNDNGEDDDKGDSAPGNNEDDDIATGCNNQDNVE